MKYYLITNSSSIGWIVLASGSKRAYVKWYDKNAIGYSYYYKREEWERGISSICYQEASQAEFIAALL